MSSTRTLRIGTRASLLAVAQSRLVAAELQRHHPQLQIEWVQAETRGDRDQQTPLAAVQDPDFFSAELQQLLLDGVVDCCVHSWKDLATKRPDGLSIAAVPARELPHDMVLFTPDIRDRLVRGTPLRIGTSSRRRESLVREFLSLALPGSHTPPQLEFVPLRGPVDQRVLRVLEQDTATRLDGVVLAVAGLARLWNDPDGHQRLAGALPQLPFMVLPLSACPTAPGQGALAIECRSNDTVTATLLASLHHAAPVTEIELEQRAVTACPPALQAAAGASAITHPVLGTVAWLRAVDDDTAAVYAQCRREPAPAPPAAAPRAWDGTAWHDATRITRNALPPFDCPALFIAHSHAVDAASIGRQQRCWTSGPASWRRLAAQGVWVEGCTDNLGFEALQGFLHCAVLRLPALRDWTAITHSDAVSGWASTGVGQVLAGCSITVEPAALERIGAGLRHCTHFYWASARQYRALAPWVPAGARHACGAGKTMAALRDLGLTRVDPFSSREEWQQWLSSHCDATA